MALAFKVVPISEVPNPRVGRNRSVKYAALREAISALAADQALLVWITPDTTKMRMVARMRGTTLRRIARFSAHPTEHAIYAIRRRDAVPVGEAKSNGANRSLAQPHSTPISASAGDRLSFPSGNEARKQVRTRPAGAA